MGSRKEWNARGSDTEGRAWDKNGEDRLHHQYGPGGKKSDSEEQRESRTGQEDLRRHDKDRRYRKSRDGDEKGDRERRRGLYSHSMGAIIAARGAAGAEVTWMAAGETAPSLR